MFIVIESGYGFSGMYYIPPQRSEVQTPPPCDSVHDSTLFEANCRNGQQKNQFIVYLLESERWDAADKLSIFQCCYPH